MADENRITPPAVDQAPVDILLVDDRSDGLLALEAVLASPGYNLVKASSGSEALMRISQYDFAVILLDVQMPGMDGFETARQIKQRPESQNIPIIFVTAINKEQQFIHQGYEAGAVDYLFKPFDPYVLKSKVEVFADLFRKNKKIHHQASEILRLNHKLSQRAADLEALNKELEAFSYSVSHDLRTPLRAIDGFSRELLENCESALDKQGKSDLRRIRAATQRMSQLIEDLLELARVPRQELSRKRINLSARVQEIMEKLLKTDPGRDIECVISPEITVEGDPPLLDIALENLLANALKFTKREPHARVEFGVAPHNGSQAFFVRDNGVGFDMAYAGKLFKPFQRLHDATEFPGTGVGLALVERIIRRHRGHIWAESKEHRGATFYFTLA
jgi:two-component system sensor histidine kinase/response regulator